ncbi:tyrosine-type recombinase/integrase [Candidatus Enterococcus courvalinii]|uniref:Tyrosine-type recombinase/integrase n=1 Tax=Candidatus Enterococcus courvalinii TaxID=2815329 RepID=A0ABS3HXG3_9ENTE|nr:tyrosine-type recombinase/integrase [Enterococcus sp. MSG2901]MBO0481158.1 tyrosine-type recombinase/integrase [Enterococcus sp. MSG2901]
MDSKTRKQIQEKLKQRLQLLPPIFEQFLLENRGHLSLSSRYEYAKDFHLFTDFLHKSYPNQEMNDEFILQLEKQDYLNFLASIYRHTRSFQTAAEQPIEQTFRNNYHGVSRKQYALNHFLKFLFQNGQLKKEISLLGTSTPETTTPAPRYVPAESLLDFETLFIPPAGFDTSREASFEKKNRPRNLAILALLLYCGLKIHEIVELKRKDLLLEKQLIQLHRKENRLNQVPLPNEACSFLTTYLTLHELAAEDFVFQSSHDEQISPRTIRQILSKVTVYQNLSPELCRKTFRYYTEQYLDDLDTVNYLCGNRYLNPHDFHEVYQSMLGFSYYQFG